MPPIGQDGGEQRYNALVALLSEDQLMAVIDVGLDLRPGRLRPKRLGVSR